VATPLVLLLLWPRRSSRSIELHANVEDAPLTERVYAIRRAQFDRSRRRDHAGCGMPGFYVLGYLKDGRVAVQINEALLFAHAFWGAGDTEAASHALRRQDYGMLRWDDQTPDLMGGVPQLHRLLDAEGPRGTLRGLLPPSLPPLF
jgi:hypothetical protein